MKILIIAYLFPPTNSIGALRPFSLAKYLTLAGHDVTVLSANSMKNNLTNNLITPSNIKIILVPHNDFITKIKFWLKLLLGKTKYPAPGITDLWWMKAYQRIKNENYDTIISTYSPYVNHLIAYLAKRRGITRKWVADYRDLWSNSHLNNNRYNLVTSYLEFRFNKSADIISTVSPPLANHLKQKHPNKVICLENGYDPDDFLNIPKKQYWSNSKVNISFTGTFYPDHNDLKPLFSAIKNLNAFKYAFTFNFFGTNTDQINQIAKQYSISDVVYTFSTVDRSTSLQIQRDSHALIFLEYLNHAGITTGKIYEYMCSKTIILGINSSNETVSGELIKNSNTGINFNNNIEQIYEFLKYLGKNKNKLQNRPNPSFIAKFDYKNITKRLIDIIK